MQFTKVKTLTLAAVLSMASTSFEPTSETSNNVEYKTKIPSTQKKVPMIKISNRTVFPKPAKKG